MNNTQSNPQKKRKHSIKNLLLLPGINEAISLVQEYSRVRAINETAQKAAHGEFGEKARQLADKNTDEALDKFLRLRIIQTATADSYDGCLETLAAKAGPKIAELWQLSEAAGRYLSNLIYWGERSTGSEVDYSPFVILYNPAESNPDALRRLGEKLEKNGAVLTEKVRKDHIYLDITELPFSFFRKVPKLVGICRKSLGIRTRDLEPGAPATKNSERALEAWYLTSTGQASKSVAKQLGFTVYIEDNPGGSYPSARNYFKLGKELNAKLIALEKFLSRIKPE